MFPRFASRNVKPPQHLQHFFRQAGFALRLQAGGDPVKCLGNAAGDAGQCVAVAAEGNRRPDHILKAVPFKKRGYRLRHRLLTAFHMAIRRPYFIAGAGKVISELPDDIAPDLFLAAAGAGKEYRACCRLCALDALRVVVRDLSRKPCHLPRPFDSVIQPSGSRDPHCGAVPVAAVGLRVGFPQPAYEASAISGVRILPAPLLHGFYNKGFYLRFPLALRIQKRLSHGYRHYGIVRKIAAACKQREILRLIAPVKLVWCPYHIA